MAADVEAILRRGAALKARRSAREGRLETIRQYLQPDMPTFTGSSAAQRQRQTSRNHILDNTAEEASDNLAGHMQGALFPANSRWFALELDRPNSQGKPSAETLKKLESDAEVLHRRGFNAPDSNFESATAQWLKQRQDFGGAVMFIGEKPGEPPHFVTRHYSECYVVLDAHGRVSAVYRYFAESAANAHEEWPGACGEKVETAARDPVKQDEPFEFLHAVYRRDDADDGAPEDPRKMRLASVYIACADKHLIREGGYPEMPYVVDFWSRIPGTDEERGCGDKAVNDVIMLQRTLKAQIEGAETLINPPMITPDDGILGNIKLYSGAVMTARSEWLMAGRNPLMPVTTNARVDLGEALAESLRERIRRAYMNHALRINRDPKMTATFALQEAEEMARLLAPQYGRVASGALPTMIQRVYGICKRNGWLMEPTREVREHGVDIRFLSPFARNQRLSEARGIVQWNEVAAGLETMEPGVRRRTVDPDRAADELAAILNVPQSVRVPEKQSRTMREQDREAAAQAAQAERMETMAQAAGQAGAAQEKFARAGNA